MRRLSPAINNQSRCHATAAAARPETPTPLAAAIELLAGRGKPPAERAAYAHPPSAGNSHPGKRPLVVRHLPILPSLADRIVPLLKAQLALAALAELRCGERESAAKLLAKTGEALASRREVAVGMDDLLERFRPAGRGRTPAPGRVLRLVILPTTQACRKVAC